MTEAPVFVHPTAIVEEGAVLGSGVKIWHFCHVMSGAKIGARSMLGQGCFAGSQVVLGEGVRVQNQVSLFDGVELADDVFVGPHAVFTNVKHPRANIQKKSEYLKIRVARGATIGANATLLPGVSIGAYAFVAAGAVVTRDVDAYALVAGVPARPLGWVSRHGERLSFEQGRARCAVTGENYELSAGTVRRTSAT
jgi:UDP-2-acetamido-3-amino-2,3-dideoxy-glucuronate N-acetyltransferase